MKTKKTLYKIIYVVIAVCAITVLQPFRLFKPTLAQAEITEPSSWGVDKKLGSEESLTRTIDQIHLVQIGLNPNYEYQDENALIRSVYYHYVFKLGYREPIANIIITPAGKAYQLTSGSLDSQIPHEKSEGIVVVGVLTSPTSSVDTKEESIDATLAYLCSLFGIGTDNIFASDITTELKETPVVALAPTEDLTLKQYLETHKESIASQIQPIPVSIAVAEKNTTVTGNSGQEVTADISIQNTGNISLYGGTNSQVILGTTNPDDRESTFYSESWPSLSRGGQIKENRIGPNETGSIEITCTSPLVPGEHQEEFKLITPNGEIVSDEIITITITVPDTGQKVLEITETGTGELNVRDNPSGSSNVLDRVPVGKQFLFDDVENNYYHIQNGESSGWISGRYVEVLKE